MASSTKQTSYHHNASDIPLLHQTIHEAMDKQGQTQGAREAFIFYDGTQRVTTLTFGEINRTSLHLAAGILKQTKGIPQGSKVALLGPNCPETLQCVYALFRLGAEVVLIPPYLSQEKEFKYALNLTKCDGIIICAEDKNKPLLDLLQASTKTTEGDIPIMNFIFSWGPLAKRFNLIEISSLVDKGNQDHSSIDSVTKIQSVVNPDSPAVIFFTSGSTGLPKAVEHTHFGMINGARLSLIHGGFEEGSKYFTDRPVMHLSGFGTIILNPPSRGISMVAANLSSLIPTEAGKAVTKILQDEKCETGLMFGYMLHDLLNSEHLDTFKIRTILTTGQVLHESQMTKLKTYLPNTALINAYASTEGSLIACTNHENWRSGTLGQCVPHMEVKIIGDDGQVTMRGTPGEICIRNYGVSKVYITPAGPVKARDEQGWFHTGDVGTMDEEGCLKILGRTSDMIRRMGYKIIPSQIEHVLQENPSIEAAQVVGIPDERAHERVVACVIMKQTASEEDLHKWCTDRCGTQGHSLAPDHILTLTEFPKGNTGKIDRKALQEVAMKTFAAV